MTIAILIFQVFIVATILITRLLSKDKLLVLCVAWTIFTLVMVFATPLVLLQLAVIWFTYSKIAPKDVQDEPSSSFPPAHEPPNRIRPQTSATVGSATAAARSRQAHSVNTLPGSYRHPCQESAGEAKPSQHQSETSEPNNLVDETLNSSRARWVALLKKLEPIVAREILSITQIREPGIIKRFEDYWLWDSLSTNEDLPWSVEFIERYIDRWDWNGLSANEGLPWSVEFIERYVDRWDWDSLASNGGLPWSIEFIERYIDRWECFFGSWQRVSDNDGMPWSVELIDQYEDRWSWYVLSNNEGLPWSAELIERYIDRWDWFCLSQNKCLPWSIEFIERYLDRWNWSALSVNNGLPWSVELIEHYEGRWHWGEPGINMNSGLSMNKGLPWSAELLERYEDRWHWGYAGLSMNEGLPWSAELLERYEDRWYWGQLGIASNEGLPWSIELIERFQNRWDWGASGLSKNKCLSRSIELIERYESRWDWRILAGWGDWQFLRFDTAEIEEIMGASKNLDADPHAHSSPDAMQPPSVLADHDGIVLRSKGIEFGSRKIHQLVHFTKVENLACIMELGILPISSLKKCQIQFSQNDPDRFDRQPNASSLSVTHPNEKLFYKWRMENLAQDWVVLKIDPSILRLQNLAFNKHNAADRRMSSKSLVQRRGINAFEDMFAEIEGFAPRASLGLRAEDSTDVQAEILAFEKIEPQMIFGAVFNSHDAMTRCSSLLGSRDVSYVKDSTGLFGFRDYNSGTRNFSSPYDWSDDITF